MLFHNGPKPGPCTPPALVGAAVTRGCPKGFVTVPTRSPLFVLPPVRVDFVGAGSLKVCSLPLSLSPSPSLCFSLPLSPSLPDAFPLVPPLLLFIYPLPFFPSV